MQRAMKLKVMMLGAVLAFSACGGSDDGGTDPGDNDTGVVGTYQLVSVNGSTPPGVISQDASKYTKLNSATLRLASNNTYSDLRNTTLVDATGDHNASDTRTGTYTSTETTVTLSFTNSLGIPATATYARSGKTITVTEGIATLTWTK